MFFTSFFHVICKISKHLAQASCTELILEKKILIRKIFHPTILFQTSYSQGRTIRLSRLNAWKGHLANFSHKYWSKTFMQHFICQKSRQLHPSDFNALFVSTVTSHLLKNKRFWSKCLIIYNENQIIVSTMDLFLFCNKK